jgi:hypothetical protein
MPKLPSKEIFLKLKFFGQIFEKYSNINFHENPTVGTEFFHADGQTDKHDEASSLFFGILRTRLKLMLYVTSARVVMSVT